MKTEDVREWSGKRMQHPKLNVPPTLSKDFRYCRLLYKTLVFPTRILHKWRLMARPLWKISENSWGTFDRKFHGEQFSTIFQYWESYEPKTAFSSPWKTICGGGGRAATFKWLRKHSFRVIIFKLFRLSAMISSNFGLFSIADKVRVSEKNGRIFSLENRRYTFFEITDEFLNVRYFYRG